MAAIEILIIEDNRYDAQHLQEYLVRHHYFVTGIASNLQDALRFYRSRVPDLVITDVFLDGIPEGISFAEILQKEGGSRRPFIFLTSVPDRTTFEQARQTNPYCYLIKPFNESDLQFTIELAVSKYTEQNNSSGKGHPGKDPQPALNPLQITKDLFIKRGDYLVSISLYEVALIEVGGKYATFHSSKGTFLVEQSLEYLESRLPSELFMRVHRNYIVNINNIDRIHLTEYTIHLKDQKNIPISRRYRETLAKRMTILR
jgi:DNA-binding LytR/AlgR family response regulator